MITQTDSYQGFWLIDKGRLTDNWLNNLKVQIFMFGTKFFMTNYQGDINMTERIKEEDMGYLDDNSFGF